jgi:hypothetical protein
MKDNLTQTKPPKPALLIGIDWADQKHDTYTIDRQGHGVWEQIEHSPEAIDAWLAEKLRQADGQPIAILIEQSRGALIHTLMFRKNVICIRSTQNNSPATAKATPTRAAKMIPRMHSCSPGCCENALGCSNPGIPTMNRLDCWLGYARREDSWSMNARG